MQIKKFEASNMNEALKMVKKEFGPAAVILSARKLANEKGIFGFSKNHGIEITAATDVQPIENKNMNSQNMVSKYYDRPNIQSVPQKIVGKNNFINSLRQSARSYGKRNRSVEQNDRFRNKETKELYTIYRQMIEQDVDGNIALKIVQSINKYAFSERNLITKGLKSCMVHVLENAGISSNRVKVGEKDRKIVAVVGPTGVGKTSTIAKLAAAAKTRAKKQDVALITLDDNRIGAIAQLKVYAKILGTPVKAALNSKEIQKYVNEFKKYNLIFIDTPGMGQKNQEQMREIKDSLDKVDGIEYHLLLSASTNEKTLLDTLQIYKEFNLRRLIFTKLDECITYGGILNQLYRSKLPVSYFTNGQNIPEDIEVATVDKLADLIFNEKDRKKYLIGPPEDLAQSIIEFEEMLFGIEEDISINDIKRNERYISAASISVG